MILQVAFGVETLTTVFWAQKRLFTAMDAHVHHIILSNAEYFSTLRKRTSEGFRARVQMKMLIKAGFASEDLHTGIERAFKFSILLDRLLGFLSAPFGL